jgi:hypothetical protein
MSKAAVSVRLFGIYVMLLGVSLVIAPNLVLGLFGMPPSTEVWLHVVGVLAFIIGVFNYVAAATEYRPYFIATVATRTLVLASFIAFVLLGMAPPVLILFGLVDFAGAIWTGLALRGTPQIMPA